MIFIPRNGHISYVTALVYVIESFQSVGDLGLVFGSRSGTCGMRVLCQREARVQRSVSSSSQSPPCTHAPYTQSSDGCSRYSAPPSTLGRSCFVASQFCQHHSSAVVLSLLCLCGLMSILRTHSHFSEASEDSHTFAALTELYQFI